MNFGYKEILEIILKKKAAIEASGNSPYFVVLGEKHYNTLNKAFSDILNAEITAIYGLSVIIDFKDEERIVVGI